MKNTSWNKSNPVSSLHYHLALTTITFGFYFSRKSHRRMPCSEFLPSSRKWLRQLNHFFFLFFVSDISCDHKNLATTCLPPLEKAWKTRARICAPGVVFGKIILETPCHQPCLVCSTGHMPGQAAQKYCSSITKDVRAGLAGHGSLGRKSWYALSRFLKHLHTHTQTLKNKGRAIEVRRKREREKHTIVQSARLVLCALKAAMDGEGCTQLHFTSLSRWNIF